jgi:hypothetical protein
VARNKSGVAFPFLKRCIVIAGQFGSRCLTFVLRLLGSVECQDRNGVDLDGADLIIGTIGLKLAVPQFASASNELT